MAEYSNIRISGREQIIQRGKQKPNNRPIITELVDPIGRDGTDMQYK